MAFRDFVYHRCGVPCVHSFLWRRRLIHSALTSVFIDVRYRSFTVAHHLAPYAAFLPYAALIRGGLYFGGRSTGRLFHLSLFLHLPITFALVTFLPEPLLPCLTRSIPLVCKRGPDPPTGWYAYPALATENKIWNLRRLGFTVPDDLTEKEGRHAGRSHRRRRLRRLQVLGIRLKYCRCCIPPDE